MIPINRRTCVPSGINANDKIIDQSSVELYSGRTKVHVATQSTT